jgi:hypothetical protein
MPSPITVRAHVSPSLQINKHIPCVSSEVSYEKCMNKKHLIERNFYMAFFAAFLPLLIKSVLPLCYLVIIIACRFDFSSPTPPSPLPPLLHSTLVSVKTANDTKKKD